MTDLFLPTLESAAANKSLDAWNSFSAAELNESAAYIKLNYQTPCLPRGAVPINSCAGWKFFTLANLVIFGHGGGSSGSSMMALPCPSIA